MHVQRGLLQVEGCAGARDRLDLRLLRRFSRGRPATMARSEEHTSELQSRLHLVCRLLLEKKKKEPKSLRRFSELIEFPDVSRPTRSTAVYGGLVDWPSRVYADLAFDVLRRRARSKSDDVG